MLVLQITLPIDESASNLAGSTPLRLSEAFLLQLLSELLGCIHLSLFCSLSEGPVIKPRRITRLSFLSQNHSPGIQEFQAACTKRTQFGSDKDVAPACGLDVSDPLITFCQGQPLPDKKRPRCETLQGRRASMNHLEVIGGIAGVHVGLVAPDTASVTQHPDLCRNCFKLALVFEIHESMKLECSKLALQPKPLECYLHAYSPHNAAHSQGRNTGFLAPVYCEPPLTFFMTYASTNRIQEAKRHVGFAWSRRGFPAKSNQDRSSMKWHVKHQCPEPHGTRGFCGANSNFVQRSYLSCACAAPWGPL